ncbi:MAG TPA: TonB-dependent receptor [Bryobacteraceae bacterium]|nr:TonB-dependent receptor [Bryobacteraceae bacterium]
MSRSITDWQKLVCLLACAVPLAAQTADTGILGKVTDPTGAAVAGAKVTITQPASGLSRSAATGADGTYEVRYLVPGQYTLSVEAAGFRAERRADVVIQIAQLARVNFSLQIGEVREVVSVTGAPPLLQTQNATLGEVVGSERTVNLPLNGRKFNDLAILTPGVQVSDTDLHSSSTAGSTIAVNGGRDIWGQVNVDGITMVNNRHNYVNIFPSVDAIQEFKVQTGNYSAEYGGNAGANVNIQIKSGSNEYHGDVFDFLRNTALDARNYFSPSPLPQNILKQNQFGATFGGPIRRDKTFFFASYEGLRSISEAPGSAVVPTAAQRAGNFSASAAPVIDPLSGAPFPGNIIPANRLNPVALNLINQYMPMPNQPGTVNYAGVSLGDLTMHQGIIRIDQYFSEKDQLFVHYIGAHRSFPDTNLNPFFTFTGDYPMNNFQAQYIHTFSPTMLNEFRTGFNLEDVSQLSTRTNTNFTIESLGINGMKVGGPNGRPLRADEEGFPLLNIAGYLGMGDSRASSNLDNSRTYQFVDNLTWIKGAHTLKFGGDIRTVRDDATTNNWPFGSISFTGDISGNPAAAYMLGYPRTVLTPEGVPITAARQWRSAFYAQDDWRVTSRLTLNLGLRYDLFNPPQDVNNVIRTLQFPPGQPPQFYPAAGQPLDPVWNVNHKDFSPRVGFAFSLDNNTVVRGGYGMFYFGGQFDNLNILQLNPPTAGSLTIINPATNPIATIQDPVPAALYPANPIFNAVTLPPGQYHPDTNVQDWNLQVSRQFGANVLEVGYVGSKGTHVDSSLQNWNQPDPGPGVIQSRRPYPEFARIRMEYFYANTLYNSLQARFEHRFTKGLSFTAAYTFSHLIDNAVQTMNSGGCGCQNPRDLSSERASSNFDQRHRLVMGYVWELPLGKNLKGVAGALAGGWSLDGIVTLASGSPFNILESFDSQNNDGIWERPNLVPGQQVTIGTQNPSLWFNTAAFAPSLLAYGNSPRNPLVGPGTHTFDLSAVKLFHMPYNEKHSLEFRAEFFNAFNTPQFSNPDASLGDAAFGRITSTKLDNREVQFALKYMF